jgi:hypothetical protein
MRNQSAKSAVTLDPEDIRRLTLLAAALRVVSIVNDLRLQRQTLSVTRAQQPPCEIEFTGRVPFAFAFTEGHEATFRVPSGHRFVIEHVTVSGPTSNTVDVQMVTRSRHMFRQVSLPCGHGGQSVGPLPDMGADHPILLQGSTNNTLLFSNGTEHSSSTVPPETYVQMWGCLEPTDDWASL